MGQQRRVPRLHLALIVVALLVAIGALLLPPALRSQDRGGSGSIAGRLLEEDGVPAIGRSVHLIRGASCTATATSGSDGRFSFTDVPAGTYLLDVVETVREEDSAYHSGLPDGVFRVVVVRDGRNTETDEYRLIRKGMTLKGRVVDTSGKPVDDATVFISGADGTHWGPVRTANGGAFDMVLPFWTLSWNPCVLKVLVLGEMRCVEEFSEWGPWRTHEVLLKCAAKTHALSGTVTTPKGPVRGAEIYVYRKGQVGVLTCFPVCRTDDSGKYSLPGLLDGEYSLHCRFPTSPPMQASVSIRGEDKGYDLENLAPACHFEARTRVSVDGQAVSDEASWEAFVAETRSADPEAGRFLKEVRFGVFIADALGYEVRPQTPLAFLEGAGDSWRFKIESADVIPCQVRIRPVRPNRMDGSIEDLFARSTPPGLFRFCFESWITEGESDKLLDSILKGIVFDARDEKSRNREILKNFSMEQAHAILGARAALLEEGRKK